MYIYYSLPIYALSHTRYKIMYMYQPTVPLEGKFCYTFAFLRLEKNVFLQGKANEKGKQN